MMQTYETLIAGLDANQQAAARIGANAVIAAGAGSGKTRVLAARYVHLIVKGGIAVDEILALTFTRKAAAEMYTRIYATLREIDDPAARNAVKNFHLARIDTIDAFCNSIARNACRNYGVSPDYQIDDKEARRLAEELALPFFLEHRKSAVVRQFMRKYSLSELPGSLFADTMVRYSSLSHPLDFGRFYAIQKKTTGEKFASLSTAILDSMQHLAVLPSAPGKIRENVAKALAELPEIPESGDRPSIAAFAAICEKLASCSLPGNAANHVLVELKEILSAFKNRQYPEFLAVLNWILNEDFVQETFALLSEFQELFSRKKRESGILTFGDVSRMAVDALREDPELRSAWKNSIKAIMIDEFQDDNDLQRDLLFLIAERPERQEHTEPKPEELCSGKLFFVGDEKQSIYRFRGADVSVFRALSRDLAPAGNPEGSAEAVPELGINYRTEQGLIASFNRIFPSVFLNPAFYTDGEIPLYEASFSPIAAKRCTPGLKPSLDVLLIPEENFTGADPLALTPAETEASEVAERIRDLIDSKYLVRKEDEATPCSYEDIAILFRSGTKQHLFERYLRESGIPYQAENLWGLFNDAPINDIYSLLRLAVYPADNTAYAMLLRSPFVAIGDDGFATAVLDRTCMASENGTMPPPFAEETEARLGDDDRARFARGRKLYSKVRELADRIPAAELISELWYNEGYRYALLTDSDLQRYAELYDFFFELARQADGKGHSLAGFLDEIAQLMSTGEKIDGLDIPVERNGGVKLMTIHKSKGLEFPVVFLADAGNDGRQSANSEPVYYSPETGISINTGAAGDIAGTKANWFYEKGKEEDRLRELAEIRRLLYVAMTRAETRLFISGTVKTKGDPVDSPRTGDALRELLTAWLDRKDENDSKRDTVSSKCSFFRLLLPALTIEDIPGVTVTEILPRSYSGSSMTAGKKPDITANPLIAAAYENIPAAFHEPSPQTRFRATDLHSILAGKKTESGSVRKTEATTTTSAATGSTDALDMLLARTGTSATDFGTFAHRAIESRFTGLPAFMPEELKTPAESMADKFLASDLGQLAAKATWRESEYGFITRCLADGREITVTGQMDLVFEAAGKVFVIDYKTDRIEDPALHAEQLEIYRKAASDLRKKPAETWLFYLRSGNAVQI